MLLTVNTIAWKCRRNAVWLLVQGQSVHSVYPQKMSARRQVAAFSLKCGLFKLIVKLPDFELAGTNTLFIIFLHSLYNLKYDLNFFKKNSYKNALKSILIYFPFTANVGPSAHGVRLIIILHS